MALSSSITSRLVCPVCRSLLAEQSCGGFRCEQDHVFASSCGVPLLRPGLTIDAARPRGGEGLLDVKDILHLSGLKKVVKDLIGTNYVPYPFNYLDHFPPSASLLNIGSGMTPRLTTHTVNLDYYLYPATDVVADAAAIPFADETFDAVVSEFTLEHVDAPFKVCAEISRVLKRGGRLYVSYPFIHPYHSFPSDYYRFTSIGMEKMLAGLVPLAKGPLTGPACRWIGSTADLASFWLTNPMARFAVRTLALALFFPLKFLDRYFNTLRTAMEHSVTLYGLFEKPAMRDPDGHLPLVPNEPCSGVLRP